ncbi:uncharacterized protein RJT20DRAFT_130226 [Scheffersomyces xylosifermentans]|uniref:uncharacterized protein n=1 Tax=Scheffersomyces xylosifermentans TaxID=1304137 RepID=UPI00315D5A90
MSAKEKGDEAYNIGDYTKAINYYSLAINNAPSNSILLSSRAKSYYKKFDNDENVTPNQWKRVIEDCTSALNLDKSNYDALYYGGLTMFFQLKKEDKGLKMLENAYATSMGNARKFRQYSLPQEIYQSILRARKTIKQAEFEQSIQSSNPLYKKLMVLLEKDYQNQIDAVYSKNVPKEVLDDYTIKITMQRISDIKDLNSVFSNNFNSALLQKHDPPDHLCDPISLNLFHDPVITPSGQSFEKSWLWQHLSANEVDPLTRQKLTKEQCYPNLGLKLCVDEYIEVYGISTDL